MIVHNNLPSQPNMFLRMTLRSFQRHFEHMIIENVIAYIPHLVNESWIYLVIWRSSMSGLRGFDLCKITREDFHTYFRLGRRQPIYECKAVWKREGF